MNYSLVLHAAAKLDYSEAYEWYEEQQQGVGERFATAFKTLSQQITDRPTAFGVRANKKYREARLKDFPYSIIYTIYKEQRIIFISSIHHHKKHPRSKYRKG